MKKGYLITVIVIAILTLSFVIFVFYFLSIFSSEMTERTHITEIDLDVKYSIKFDYVSSSLSTNVIQIIKFNNKTKEEYILERYEYYDNIVGYCLRGDSMTIYLRNGYRIKAQSSNYIECDTFHLNINDVKGEYFRKCNSEKNSSLTCITGMILNVQYGFQFYRVSSPLSAGSIQIRQIHNVLISGNYNGGPREESHEVYLLAEFDGYDNMVAYSLQGDSMIIYLRKGYWLGKQSSNFVECDTFHLNINDVKWKLK